MRWFTYKQNFGLFVLHFWSFQSMIYYLDPLLWSWAETNMTKQSLFRGQNYSFHGQGIITERENDGGQQFPLGRTPNHSSTSPWSSHPKIPAFSNNGSLRNTCLHVHWAHSTFIGWTTVGVYLFLFNSIQICFLHPN